MRIALVTMEFQGDPGHGGIGIHVYHLALGLVELGHDVHVVTNSQLRDDYTFDDGIHIHRAKIAELEGTESAVVLASGIAAVSATMMALLSPGDHFLTQVRSHNRLHLKSS